MARTQAGNRFKARNFGTCLSFTSSSTYISAPLTVLQNINSGYTISCWVKRRSFGSRAILFRSSNFNDVLWFNFENDSTLRMYHSALSPSSTQSTAKILDNNWHNIIATYNGTTVLLYIDGVQVATQAVTGSLGISASQTLFIGSTDGSNSGAVSNQLFDEPLIYSRAWTSTEVTSYYYNGTLPATNKVLVYLFDEGSGTTATDSSGNSNTGTITGATYSTDVVCIARTIPSNILGSALYMNGSPDKCVIGSVLYSHTEVTACMWFKLPATPGGSFEVPFGYGNSHWFFIFNASSTQLSFHIINSGGEKSSGVPASTPSLDTWHFVSGTYDPLGGSNNLTCRLYDSTGTLLASNASTQTGDMSAPNGGGVLEMGHDTRRGIYNKIILDDCRIYSTVLSTADQDLLATKAEPVESTLVGRWGFDELSGSVAIDVSPGANNGVISGSTYVTGITNRFPVRIRAI